MRTMKKVTLVVASVAMLVMAVPAMASASVELWTADNPGIPAEPGTSISGSASYVTLSETTFGEVGCGATNVTGEVTENGEGTIALGGMTGTVEGCELRSGAPFSLTDFTLGEVRSSELGSGTASVSYTMEVGSFWICDFFGEGSIEYEPRPNPWAEPSLIEVSIPVQAVSPMCEAEEGGTVLTANFDLTTLAEVPAVLVEQPVFE